MDFVTIAGRRRRGWTTLVGPLHWYQSSKGKRPESSYTLTNGYTHLAKECWRSNLVGIREENRSEARSVQVDEEPSYPGRGFPCLIREASVQKKLGKLKKFGDSLASQDSLFYFLSAYLNRTRVKYSTFMPSLNSLTSSNIPYRLVAALY